MQLYALTALCAINKDIKLMASSVRRIISDIINANAIYFFRWKTGSAYVPYRPAVS